MEDSLDWSEEEYQLTDFVNKFTLPQVVRVEQGFHSGEDDTALGWGQVLTIHVVKEADTVVAKDAQERKVYIPKTCSQKVEVLIHGARNNYYETVAELSFAFPQFARVTREPLNQKLNLHVGDKLALKRVSKKKNILECENQNGARIGLPMSLQARFVPLHDGREYFIHEVIHLFDMPMKVVFTDTKFGKSATSSTVFNSTLGVLSLVEVMKEETIICSTKDETTDKRYVMTIPRNMKITVAATRGAIVEDQDYMRLCRALNDGVELLKVDALESENIYASRQEVREYMQLQLLNVESHVYSKPVAPRPLPRIAKDSECSLFPKAKSPGNEMEEYDGDDSIYESIPVKGSPIKKQEFTCSDGNQYQDMPQVIIAPKAKVSDNKTENPKPTNSEESETDQITEPEDPPPLPTSPKPTQTTIDVPSLSVDDVADLLAKHRLGRFAETFRDEEIDGSMLLELDLDSLKDLGLNNFQAKKLLMLIQGWQPKIDG